MHRSNRNSCRAELDTALNSGPSASIVDVTILLSKSKVDETPICNLMLRCYPQAEASACQCGRTIWDQSGYQLRILYKIDMVIRPNLLWSRSPSNVNTDSANHINRPKPAP